MSQAQTETARQWIANHEGLVALLWDRAIISAWRHLSICMAAAAAACVRVQQASSQANDWCHGVVAGWLQCTRRRVCWLRVTSSATVSSSSSSRRQRAAMAIYGVTLACRVRRAKWCWNDLSTSHRRWLSCSWRLHSRAYASMASIITPNWLHQILLNALSTQVRLLTRRFRFL